MEIVDAHTHVGSCMSAIYFDKRIFSAEELIREMDKNGVSKAVVSGGGEPHNIELMNNRALDAVRKYPDRLIGFVRINPVLEGASEILKKYVIDYKFKGVKLHPTQDAYQLLDPRVHRIVAEAEKLDVPILIHSGSVPYAMPGQVADLAATHQQSKLIMAHAGKLDLWQHVLPSAKRTKNLYLEFSFTHHIAVKRAIDALGPNRVLFGSNWPAGSMRTWIETVKKVEIFDDLERTLFLGGNLVALLGTYGQE